MESPLGRHIPEGGHHGRVTDYRGQLPEICGDADMGLGLNIHVSILAVS